MTVSIDLLWDVIKFLLGIIVGGAGGYFVLHSKVSSMSGKLEILIGMLKLAEENREKVGEVKAYAIKNRQDMNHYFTRLRTVEEKTKDLPIGSGH